MNFESSVEGFVEKSKKTGKLSPVLANEPERPVYLLPYIDAFWKVSRANCSSTDYKTPLSEINTYIQIYNITDPQYFTELMIAMDEELCLFKNKKAEEAALKAKNKR